MPSSTQKRGNNASGKFFITLNLSTLCIIILNCNRFLALSGEPVNGSKSKNIPCSSCFNVMKSYKNYIIMKHVSVNSENIFNRFDVLPLKGSDHRPCSNKLHRLNESEDVRRPGERLHI